MRSEEKIIWISILDSYPPEIGEYLITWRTYKGMGPKTVSAVRWNRGWEKIGTHEKFCAEELVTHWAKYPRPCYGEAMYCRNCGNKLIRDYESTDPKG